MERPNALLVSVDHWPGSLVGALGHPAILTPTLDQLIETGIAYTNAYSAVPACIPARREIMTGTHARTHGDRIFKEYEPMPEGLPTMAQTFRDAGYQAYAVGKLHVYPPRDRIGFDDALLNEEGRHHLGMVKDDYEMFLAEQGYAGHELAHGMGSNDYTVRPYHLPERLSWTNWTARQMSSYIVRRDPSKPAFWYMSFNAPHPPLAPPKDYLEMYADVDIDMPVYGDWCEDFDAMPYAIRVRRFPRGFYSDDAIRVARRAFYALCTHIDHQMRLVIGLLREEGLLENTAIMFTSDHGDVLGDHGTWAKDTMYEGATRIPMVLAPPAAGNNMPRGKRDDRLALQADIMPTLLAMCGIPVPGTVEGLDLLGERQRQVLYGEHYEDAQSTRMVRDARYKLIYYPVGNRVQLFDLHLDREETRDLSNDPAHADTRARLEEELISLLYGGDTDWVQDGRLVGLPDMQGPNLSHNDRQLGGQRGWRF
ncbi:MAG: arylsulfatase [SAR202 cluster bacterium]|nr:arylsulfatase [SAR202 cluster bacterium]